MISHKVGSQDDKISIRWVKLEALDAVPVNHGFALLEGVVQPSTWRRRLANGMDLLGSFSSSWGRTNPGSSSWRAGVNSLASISSIFSSVSTERKDQRDEPDLDIGMRAVDYMPVRGTYAYDVLQRRFKELDKEGTNYISEGDLKVALKRLNLPASEQDIQIFMNEVIGTSRSNKITFEKFAEYAINRENELLKTFNELDKQKTGYISVAEMKEALRKYNFRLTDKDIDKMIGASHLRSGLLGSSGIHGSMQVLDFAEFRYLLMLSTAKDLRGSFEVWGRAVIDLGDVDTSFPLSSGRYNKRARFGQRREKWHIFRHLFAAAISAAASRTLVAPLERVKILSMVDFEVWKNEYFLTFSKIWRDEGIGGLFKGNLLNVLCIAPTKVVEFLVYDKFKELLLRRTDKVDISATERVALGSIASLAGTFISYPIDTLRTAIIVQVGGDHKGVVNSTRCIMESKGLPGLYSGTIPMMIRVASYGAIGFIIYDCLKQWHRKNVGPGGKLGLLPTVIFGALAGAFAQTAVYPLETVQRRLQAQAVQQSSVIYQNMISAFRVIIRDEGAKGLYAGLSLNYLKLVPAAAISILIYEVLNENLNSKE